MSGIKLTEITIDLITAEIKAQIDSALASVRSDRADAQVTTESPRSYFIYGSFINYRCPAVAVVMDSIDFQKDRGANHTNANMRVKVAVIVEDINLLNLTVKSYRYQAALHKILNQTELISADQSVKIVCIVKAATFSPEFTDAQTEDYRGAFRKEVMLDLEVRHLENY